MTQTFDQIKTFYRSHWGELSIFDLSMLASHCAVSIPTGNAIELSHFDGFIHRRKSIQPADRADALETLKLVTNFLTERLKTMPQEELDELDRVQQVLSQASELPKRLADPNL
jgi:flagellar basal body rod protein FlgF